MRRSNSISFILKNTPKILNVYLAWDVLMIKRDNFKKLLTIIVKPLNVTPIIIKLLTIWPWCWEKREI